MDGAACNFCSTAVLHMAMTFLALLLLSASPSLKDFDGTWELDLKASSDPAAMLDRLGAPWVLKKSATSVTVTQVISSAPGSLTVEAQSAMGSRSSTQVLDGKTPKVSELFGMQARVISVFQGGEIRSTGTLELEGGPVPLSLRRTVEADGTMHLVITLAPKDEAPVSITRVFRRR